MAYDPNDFAGALVTVTKTLLLLLFWPVLLAFGMIVLAFDRDGRADKDEA